MSGSRTGSIRHHRICPAMTVRDPGLIQAGTLMTLIIPVVAFLLTQRFFTRGLVVTGIDK